MNVIATYTDIGTKYKMVKRGGLAGLLGGKKVKEEKFELSALCDEKGFILADFYISLNKNKFVIAIDIELKNIFLTIIFIRKL